MQQQSSGAVENITYIVSANGFWLRSMQKTSQSQTHCKGDISHAFETTKITVFYPTLCQTPDTPLQNELLY